MECYKHEFIKFMISSGVLSFGSFTTKSGRVTPYFVNTGNYKTGEQIAKLGDYYAQCMRENFHNDFNVIFGPAYKGIPLAVAASISLYRKFGLNIPYCFNRKEKKDHGEGGNIIGYPLQNRDRILIIEDVITAGTSVRESIPLLKSMAEVEITSLVISVDRLEKGVGEKSTLQELATEFGMKVKAIVTIEEILGYLFNREIDGKVLVDNEMKERIEDYLRKYGF